MRDTAATPARRPRRKPECGIALIEMVIVASLLGLALLFHAASTVSGQQLMRAEGSQSRALQTARTFIERLRTDPSFGTLYERLATLAGTPHPALGHPIAAYYDDLETPTELGEVGIVVEVPRAVTPADLGADTLVLREDMNASRFGLPFDLNGDGLVDDRPHDDDYVALPIILHFNWTGYGEAPQTLRVDAWLRGPK